MKILQSNNFKAFKGIVYWAAFFTYSQSLIVFFWDLNSLLLRFSLAEILGFLSYHLTFSLAESIIVSLVVFIILYILPSEHVRNNIQTTGSLLIISLAINGILFRNAWQLTGWLESSFTINQDTAQQIVQFLWLYSILGLPVISVIITKYQKINAIITTFTENLSVLGNIYFTLSICGVLIVLYRNIL